jgi:hypothetical protein
MSAMAGIRSYIMARGSSVAQLRSNVPIIDITVLADASVEDRIDEADKFIESKLSKIIDFDEVTYADGTTTPEYINLLSQYKTAELSLVAVYGLKRDVDGQVDIEYWKKAFMELLMEIMNGEIDITDEAIGSIAFTNNVREDVPPALGMGEQGGFIDEDDLGTQREDLGND